MPSTEWGWLVTPDELRAWTIFEDDQLLVVNKPAGLVCHPSKHGPWSSLIGAARETLGLERLHMPSRLDRETSGIVVFAKNAEMGSRLQRAIQRRTVRKIYHALLTGTLDVPVTVEEPLGKAFESEVWVRQGVRPDGADAVTRFEPLGLELGCTLARVQPETGRLHQIRAHAAHLGCPVAGDKIYGPDETLFLEFLAQGWTDRMRLQLRFRNHCLHASEWSCEDLHYECAPDFRDRLDEGVRS